MRILSKKELLLLESLFKMKQQHVHKFVKKCLLQYYMNQEIVETEDYICAIGDIPIALCAHLDTVWEEKPPMAIFYDREKGALWSPNGLGADDRAGIFAILNILSMGLRPHLIFTHDEETGGLGAEKLALADSPFPQLKYIIELDRRGRDDCVFYDCMNKNFHSHIESFGFTKQNGSFSDISILCGAWKVCGTNLSIGYVNEHIYSEMLFVSPMFETIQKVKKILRQDKIPSFKWEGPTYIPMGTYDYYRSVLSAQYICQKCKKKVDFSEVMPVRAKDGSSIHYYCVDCIPDGGFNFCSFCDMPYEEDGGDLSDGICAYCLKNGGYFDTGIR